MRKELGCLSITAVIAVLITVAGIAGALFSGGNSLFSAGSLNAQAGASILGGVLSHTEIGAQCKLCHAAPWDSDSMADRCLVCHTQVTAELTTTNSLHEVLFRSAPNHKCNACHPDHRGAQASLLEMDLADFPHNDLNFRLNAHQKKLDGSPFGCADCHAGKYANPFDVATCVNCHYDMQADFTQAHALEFDLNCLNCHDGFETYGAKFDHNQFPFSLTGKHVQAVCADCHKNAHTNMIDLRSTPQDCFSCHQADDNHNGLFGTNCMVCHSPEGWKPAKIDHNLSKFPLEGKHIDVACEKCHANNVFAGTPQDCFSCHKQDDSHNGQLGTNCKACHSPAGWNQVHVDHSLFAFPLTGAHVKVACETCHQNGIYKSTPQDCYSCHQKDEAHGGRLGTDCATCHSTNAWKPASFDHNRSVFKLTGVHVSVACTSCHKNNVFKGTPQDCYSCHQKDDNHKGQLGTNCSTCHSTSGWKPATFNHNLSAFKLTGSHVGVSCTSCHKNNVFKGTPQDCYSCHQKDDNHKGQLGTNCSTCHSINGWKPATFNHNLSAFKLTGAHVGVSCTSCHKNNVFKDTPQDCYSCHKNDDSHKGQFGTNCSTCHSTSGWKPATFDHNLSAFKLTGAHVSVACTSCHINGVFKGTPQDCYSCHKNDDNHNGQFGTNCSACHTTSAWKPSTFNHNSSAFKLTGAHVSVACTSCHINGIFKGTPQDCYSCHQKDDNHNGQLGTNCSTCHSTNAWKPSTFNHNSSVFKLTGAHVNVACTSCHINGVFKGTPQDCYSCHKNDDNHNGQFGTNCSACHTTSAWKPATFDHNLSAFKLTGAHVSVACTSCHKNGVFRGTPTDCYSCHSNDDEHNGKFGTDCAACHTTSTWKGATFDHSLSGFPLTGQHTSLMCERCHTGGKFTGLSSACVSCHDDPAFHSGMFGTKCADCHGTSNWSATYSGSHPNIANEGGSGVNHGHTSCRTCHTSTLHDAVCTACHDGNGGGDGGD